ncbi:Strigolactone esterase D14-like protein [Drosera capensis]
MVVLRKNLSVSMNAKIIGSGDEVVVLGHGYGGDHSIWDKVVPSLSKKYRVLVFDRKFSGAARAKGKELEDSFDPVKYSTYDAFADDLIGLMDEMELRSLPVFVGHSMSGMIGCIASIKRPQLFKKLILVGASPRPQLFKKLILVGASPRYLNSEDYEGGFERPEVDQLLSAIQSNFHSWASAFATLAVGGKDVQAAAKFEKTIRSMTPHAALSLAKAIFLGDWRHILKDVTVPCIIVQTTNDIVVPVSVGYYMQEKMIKGKTKVENIDCYGHFPQLTAHELLLAVLGRALSS